MPGKTRPKWTSIKADAKFRQKTRWQLEEGREAAPKRTGCLLSPLSLDTALLPK